MIRWLLAAVLVSALPLQAQAQTFASQAQFQQLVRYVGELAVKRNEDAARIARLEALVTTQRAAMYQLIEQQHNENCNWNTLMQNMAAGVAAGKASVPAITYDSNTANWKSCLDATKPAPVLTFKAADFGPLAP